MDSERARDTRRRKTSAQLTRELVGVDDVDVDVGGDDDVRYNCEKRKHNTSKENTRGILTRTLLTYILRLSRSSFKNGMDLLEENKTL